MIYTSHIVDVAAIKTKTDQLNFTAGNVHSNVKAPGVLNDLSVAEIEAETDPIGAAILALNDVSTAEVNAQVDSALNTAIPGSPVAGSVNDKLISLASVHTMTYALSDTIIHANDAEGNIDEAAYTKVKEILCPITGTLRIKFKIRSFDASDTARGKVYKNGIAHGTERVDTTGNYVEFSEDLAFTQGDTIELWCYRFAAGKPCYYKELRVCGNLQRYFENTLE